VRKGSELDKALQADDNESDFKELERGPGGAPITTRSEGLFVRFPSMFNDDTNKITSSSAFAN
jgi:hypothetical protein